MEVSTNLGRVSLVPRGEYSPQTAYERLDVVQYQGSGYLVLRAVRGVEPQDGADYMLLAQRGLQGQKGDPGPAGANGKDGEPGQKGERGADGTSFIIRARYETLAELEAAHPTGEAGEAYAVGSAESNTVYLWNVDKGQWQDIGSMQGPAGENGKTAYQYAVEGGYAGTEAEFKALLGLTGTIAARLDSLNGEVV